MPAFPPPHSATFRFYEELNDFLPPERRKRAFTHAFHGTPAVKDAIEALGVPHPEIDLILVDGASVGFEHRLEGGERVAVYPMFERFDIAPLGRLRPEPLREPRFVLDVHLGKLARYLRLLGFDARYRNDFADPELVAIAADEHRVILTRDVGVLKHGAVTHGHWMRATDPSEQLVEVLEAFDLRRLVAPFTRCLACNGPLEQAAPTAVADEVPAGVLAEHDAFHRCTQCRKVYWKGSHYDRMQRFIRQRLEAASGSNGTSTAGEAA